MERASAARLADGRLHLHHGPIDLIITVEGPGRGRAETAVIDRFETVLEDLAEELPMLRSAVGSSSHARCLIAWRMVEATQTFLPEFITPMAAVAGAVADELIATICLSGDVTKAIVNNGGDVALYLGPDETAVAEIAGTGGSLRFTSDSPYRGIASSGWRGRSWSLGIADTVTVIARSAASADAAATMIANRVDLPGHPAIRRQRAEDLASESDLSGLLVTTGVGLLTEDETKQALQAGAAYAKGLLQRDLIGAAALMLNDQIQYVGDVALLSHPSERKITYA